MIVKNESAIIERCLDAAKPILDYVFICDTGSSDGTQDLILNWLEKNNMEGKVFEEVFQNFGHNRTSAFNKAREAYPEADYIFLMDADERLEVLPKFNKDTLSKDSYTSMQYSTTLKYWNKRLLKSSLNWECVGVTHEYWDSESKEDSEKLPTLIVNDLGDGGSKTDKFARDERLLLEGLSDADLLPNLQKRYLFYLANTYHDTKQYEKAIKWYEKRIKEKGWEEEVYYSYYRIGLCYHALSENSEGAVLKAIAYLSQAWQYRPTRAEPLYELARIYRAQGNYLLATLCANKGLEIPFPKNDVLFIVYPVYDYLLKFELSISGYYVDKKIGMRAQRYLENKSDLPDKIKKQVQKNSRFYEVKASSKQKNK